MTPLRFPGMLLVALLIGSGTVRAQSAGSESGTPQPAPAEEAKSPALAAALSAGAPLIGYGLIAASAQTSRGTFQTVALLGGIVLGLVGPSTGNIYAGQGAHATLFSVGRFGFAALAFTGMADLLGHDDGETGPPNRAVDYPLLGIGVAGLLALTVWEPFDAYHSAQVANRTPRNVALVPLLPAGGSASPAGAGLLLSGRF